MDFGASNNSMEKNPLNNILKQNLLALKKENEDLIQKNDFLKKQFENAMQQLKSLDQTFENNKNLKKKNLELE